MGHREAEVQELLRTLRERGSDHSEVEAKRAGEGCPNLGETLSAFGNMPSGGTIILGLDESQGFEATGVVEPSLVSQGVASQARNAISPPVQVDIEELLLEKATLVVVTVAPLPSHQRPAYFRGRAYLRQGDGDYAMSEQEIQQILARRERPRHDATPVAGTSTSDLDQELTDAFVSRARSTSRRLADRPAAEVLRRKGVIAPDGTTLTIAGLYVLGSYPQQHLPDLSITAAVQHRVADGRGLSDLVHLDGPLPDLLESAMDWVRRNTRTSIRFDAAGNARDREELPMIAVRELIANALVHRDLGPHTQGKRVEIRLKDDTLVISSPGGLYGVAVEQLGQPEGKSAVNEFLYEICKLARTPNGDRIIEGEGGGIQEVKRVLLRENMRPPKFVDRGVGFTAFLPRHALIETADLDWIAQQDPENRLTSMQRQIVATMRHGSVWTNGLVRKRFAPIDSTAARSALQGLVSFGLAQVNGERAQTEYSLASDLQTSSAPETATPHPDGSVNISFEIRDTEPTPRERVLRTLRSNGPMPFSQIVERTGLTSSQARYALKGLANSQVVEISGGRGVRGTTYSVTNRSRE